MLILDVLAISYIAEFLGVRKRAIQILRLFVESLTVR